MNTKQDSSVVLRAHMTATQVDALLRGRALKYVRRPSLASSATTLEQANDQRRAASAYEDIALLQ